MGIDELSGRLLNNLAQKKESGDAGWRTSLARIGENWDETHLSSEFGSGGGGGGDLAVCALFVFLVWWFGVWLVRQWSKDMANAYSQLQPSNSNAYTESGDIEVEVKV
ncbi:hypothetical protein GGI21_002564 [Coemansia aciculifera]|nr:hypothetical protein GGI21_002564 [Coemansia aciculifera]